MKIILKRLVSYLIDIIIVSIFATLITSNSYINKDYEKYNNVYEEYINTVDEYEKSKEELETKKDSIENYDEKLETLNKEYNKKQIDYSYELSKLSIIPSVFNIICILMYFVVIQYYFDGQTLGKKIMKLKVAANNKPLNILNYLLRSLILNEVLINMLSIFFIIILSKNNFLLYSKISYVITYVIELIIVFMIIFTKDNRGLHDMIANTKVVETNKKEDFSNEM